MGRLAWRLMLAIAVTLPALAVSAEAIEITSIKLGILVSPVVYPCPVKPETSRWAANDWDTSIVVQLKDINRGDKIAADVTVPNGRGFKRTSTWTNASSRGCDYLFVPILGTDAEAWQGAWRAVLSLNGKKVSEVTWEVTPARENALAEYQTYLAANQASARAHYRVGTAAALAGQDALAESELKEAARISPTWWYPPLALGRLYHRQGKDDLARERFYFMKGLLLGRQADPGSFTEYIQAMLDDHLKQLGP